MLISASRRPDIPACFSHWFFRRIEEGYVLVRNPMNPHKISRVSLSPQDVDGIMFWTKNPLPMLAAGPGDVVTARKMTVYRQAQMCFE